MHPNLGDGKTQKSETPVKVSGITDAVGIWAGDGSAAILTSDGSVWTWGGNHTSVDTMVPERVVGENETGFFNLYDPKVNPYMGADNNISFMQGFVIVSVLCASAVFTARRIRKRFD